MRKKTKKKSIKLLGLIEKPSYVSALATLSLIPRDFTELKQIEKVRHSGHYVDQKLKHNKPSDNQFNLFDSLSTNTQSKINEEDRATIVEGIKLSMAEDKIMNSILNLLHRKSNVRIDENNRPAEPEKFYKGNLPAQTISYGGNLTNSPVLRFTPHEFFTEVTGSKDYSGQEIKNCNETLKGLGDKTFLITYKRHRKVKKGNGWEKVIDRIEEYQPLFKIIKYYEGLTEKEDRALDSNYSKLANEKGEIILKLNPLFIDQIDTKFILYPTDINRKTEIASGGAGKVTTAIRNLRDYLLRAISNKNYTIRIDKETLPYILCLDTYIKQSRQKLINQRISESLQAVRNLGLALEINETTGAKYQPQYEFILNPNF